VAVQPRCASHNDPHPTKVVDDEDVGFSL
jgi:hypothetical protein